MDDYNGLMPAGKQGGIQGRKLELAESRPRHGFVPTIREELQTKISVGTAAITIANNIQFYYGLRVSVQLNITTTI